MATMRASGRWFDARRALVVLALAGWSILVVVGAGRAPQSDEWFAVPDLGGVLLAVLGLLALIGAAVLIYFRPTRKAGVGPRTTQPLRALLFTAIVITVFATWFNPEEPPEELATAEQEPAVTAQQEAVRVGSDTEVGPRTADLVALLVIALIAAAAILRSRRPGAAAGSVPANSPGSSTAGLHMAIDEATRQLLSPVNPREAVLAAYASMEAALAHRGQDRDPAETPTEHIARVLADFPALAGPCVQLGRLYELARFSDEPISSGERDVAAAALAEARRGLRTHASGTP